MKDIVLKNITKKYDDQAGLEPFSAVFSAGSFTSVMGPSGCGKTTLLQILAGLEKPDGGDMCPEGLQVSYVFQSDRLCQDFNAAANIQFVTGDGISRETIDAHLCSLGLGDALDKPVSELSGGMKRRVAIARGVLAGGDLLLLDEPFKGLDEELKLKVMEYVRENLGGRTVVMVTHDEAEAEFFGGRIIRIEG